jgi:Flp pilus assembly protein TadD
MFCRLSNRKPKRIGAAALLVALLSLPGSPARADLAKDWSLALRAVDQIVEGRPAAAILTLKQMGPLRSRSEVEGLVGLAASSGAHAGKGYPLLAQAAKRGSLALLQYWAGRAAFAAKKPREALAHFERAIAMGGEQPLFRVAQALVAKAMGRDREALAALESAAGRWANLADPRLFPVPAEGAVQLLSSLLERFPHPLDLARTQGYLYWRLGRILQAQERFATLVSARPGDADALQMLARCSARLGKSEEALRLARQALEAAPELGSVRATIGELLLAAGDAKGALVHLRRAVDVRPRDARLLTLLAQACAETQDTSCATKFFRYAVRREPRSIEAQIGLAVALQDQGDTAGATRAAARAVALEPIDPQVYRVAAHLATLREQKKLAKELTVRANKQRKAYRSLENRRKKQRKRLEIVMQASTVCRCTPRCQRHDRKCRLVVRRLRGATGTFMSAHQALQRAKVGHARRMLRSVLRALNPSRLLSADPLRVVYRPGGDDPRLAVQLGVLVAFD